MLLESRETCIAYLCPYCGSGVKSVVGVFALSGDMKKLKCDCQASELTITHTGDGKLRVTVPCLFCHKEHSFTISSKLFFEKELFAYPCPYTGINIVFLGSLEKVESALDENEKEILKLLKEAGIDDLLGLCADPEDDTDHSYIDPTLYDSVMYVIRDLMESGDISCCCDDGDYDVAVSDDHVKVFCKSCGAAKDIPTDSELSVQAFIGIDRLKLEKL